MTTIKFQFTAMDTQIKIEGTSSIDMSGKQNEIKDWFERFESICSRFRSNSDLSILNQKPKNTVIQVHPILFQVLAKAVQYAYKTDFYFNPFVGSVLSAAGYNTTFSEIKRRNEFIQEPYHFEWNDSEPIVLLPMIDGVIKKVDEDIDLGGIAKGWSVDQVVRMIKGLGIDSGIVNAGGDLFAWGDNFRTIGVSHPHPDYSENDILQFTFCNGGVATSNTLYRSWQIGDGKAHHILDGKSGKSSQTDIIQATVFSTSTTEADVLAKVLCMHSFQEAVSWLAKQFPHAACIVINNKGQIAMSSTIKNYVTKVVM